MVNSALEWMLVCYVSRERLRFVTTDSVSHTSYPVPLFLVLVGWAQNTKLLTYQFRCEGKKCGEGKQVGVFLLHFLCEF